MRENVDEIKKGADLIRSQYEMDDIGENDAEKMYRDIGKNFKNFGLWQIYILTASENFEKLYSRRADKIRKLYNGMIPCNLYQFFKPIDR